MAVKEAALAYAICGSRDYSITTSKTRTERLEVKKSCKHCKEMTLHKKTR